MNNYFAQSETAQAQLALQQGKIKDALHKAGITYWWLDDTIHVTCTTEEQRQVVDRIFRITR